MATAPPSNQVEGSCWDVTVQFVGGMLLEAVSPLRAPFL